MGLKLTFVLVALIIASVGSQDPHPELPRLVKTWADKLGGELWHFGELVTRRMKVIESFRHAIVTPKDGMALLDDIKQRVKNMMDKKVAAVSRIMEIAENVAATAQEIVEDDYDYFNSKDLTNTAAPPPEDETVQDDEEEPDMQSEALHRRRDRDSRYASMMIQTDSDDYQLDQEEVEEVVPPDQPIITSDEGDVDGDQGKLRPDSTSKQKQEQEQEQEGEVPLTPEQEEKSNENDGGNGEAEAEGNGKSETDEDFNEQEPMASLKPPVDKRRLPLYPNRNFYNTPVNLNVSTVHVPSNVYDRSPEVIKGIKWSEELDKSFKDNFKQDPSISWQYFGSSTGFMRQYPGVIWNQEPVDLYDCRMRNWYIEAASSPKDVVILIDRSGSMTGMRREIAKHVVNNILDTLGNNDYVNIYTFSNTTDPLIECFDGHLVQANLANVRMFKDAMPLFRTEQIANFSLALTRAFELLQDYRENRPGQGAQCNQAIMLVTDGVYYNFKEIFKEYNWKNLPFMPVRVFTYLIGREVSDVREVKWMACANQGYYVHLSTYAEVREQVLNYLPVMARPMVLNPTLKPRPTWSPVYADAMDPKLTNWLWLTRERTKQRDRFYMYFAMRNKSSVYGDSTDRKYLYQQRRMDFNTDQVEGESQIYRMMTSVSLPVYDKRQNANISEKIQINEKIWITVTKETRIANLLGVAGTDVPIENIERLLLPYRIGVNGYAFIVTNNGYILLHPDLRPIFQGILKPAYNRVDLVEAELFDDETEPREFSDEMIALRAAVVNQTTGKREARVKYHLDEMNRILFGKRHYFYKGIDETPFTLVLAIPDRYGLFEIDQQAKEDKHRIFVTHNNNLTQFFTGNWTVHPRWHYCRYLHQDKHPFESPREELLHFLEKMSTPGWKWNNSFSYCDRTLINRVLYDAKVTEWFHTNISASNKDDNGHEFIQRFGITVAFLATHSGLTRWQDFPQNTGQQAKETHEPHFHYRHAHATEEVWYRRAVEQNYKHPRSFVYAVPFDADFADNENDILVTASHAVFKEDTQGSKRMKAVVGVVGFQIYHRALHTLFQNITGHCIDSTCKRTCSSEELACMLLDDNGFVVVAYDRNNTGRFLGDFRADILEMLYEEGIYNRTRVYDYQATCFPNVITGSPATTFANPFGHFADIFYWFLSTVVYFARVSIARPSDDFVVTEPYANVEEEADDEQDVPQARAFEKDFDQRWLVNKTNPQPCDTEFYLYHLTHYTATNNNVYNRTMKDCAHPFLVQPVSGSNMILLVINQLCPDVSPKEAMFTPNPVDIAYFNESRHCYILFHNNFPRKNYMSCINRSIHEPNIQLCGSAGINRPMSSSPLFVLLFLLVRFVVHA